VPLPMSPVICEDTPSTGHRRGRVSCVGTSMTTPTWLNDDRVQQPMQISAMPDWSKIKISPADALYGRNVKTKLNMKLYLVNERININLAEPAAEHRGLRREHYIQNTHSRQHVY
jgi:hypothetical protein